MHLRRGGPCGDIYATVAKPGDYWVAVLNLYPDASKLRSLRCDSEMAAILTVEEWIEAGLKDCAKPTR